MEKLGHGVRYVSDVTRGGEHTKQYTEDVLQNCIP